MNPEEEIQVLTLTNPIPAKTSQIKDHQLGREWSLGRNRHR